MSARDVFFVQSPLARTAASARRRPALLASEAWGAEHVARGALTLPRDEEYNLVIAKRFFGIQKRREGSPAGFGRRPARRGSHALIGESRGSGRTHDGHIGARETVAADAHSNHHAVCHGCVFRGEGGAFSFHSSIVTRSSGM